MRSNVLVQASRAFDRCGQAENDQRQCAIKKELLRITATHNGLVLNRCLAFFIHL